MHSRLPPSSAFRWSRCTASVKFVEDNEAILPKGGSKEADEGTRAHAYMTALLKHTLGQVPDSPEMAGVIQKCVDYIATLRRPLDALFVDQRVPLFYLPSQYGTLDVAIIDPDRITILDLKYGVGVGVYAEENEQLVIYAESQIRVFEKAFEVKPTTPVHLVIYQPRDRNDPEPVRKWVISREELANFCKNLQTQAEIVLQGSDLKFDPGVACKFCRAEGICPATATRGLAPISDEPVDTVIQKRLKSLPLPTTREQRNKILASKKDMIAWLEAVENQEVAELLAGAPPLQFKLVEGKTNRAWSDDRQVAKLLLEYLSHDAVYPPVTPEIVSPAQAEKQLKGHELTDKFKADFAALIVKPEGRPTLVPLSDKRPALNFRPTEGLSKIETSQEAFI